MASMHNEEVDHASRAILFGVLAASIYHAERTKASDFLLNFDCRKVHRCSAERATYHLQESIRTETNGAKKAKYKDQLMAILVLNAVAVRYYTPAYSHY